MADTRKILVTKPSSNNSNMWKAIKDYKLLYQQEAANHVGKHWPIGVWSGRNICIHTGTSAFTHTHTHTGLPQLVSPSVPLPYSTNCTMCVGNTSEGHPAYTSLTRQQGGTRQPQHVSDMSLILIRIAKYRPHLPALSLL